MWLKHTQNGLDQDKEYILQMEEIWHINSIISVIYHVMHQAGELAQDGESLWLAGCDENDVLWKISYLMIKFDDDGDVDYTIYDLLCQIH